MVRKTTIDAMSREVPLKQAPEEDVELVEYSDCPPIDFSVHIKGIRPLMFSRFPDKSEKPLAAGAIVVPKVEADKRLYRDKKGNIYLPAEHIEGALINAAKGMQMPGKGKKTYKDEVAQNIIVIPQTIPFKEPKNPEDYEIDSRVVVMKQLGRRWSHRPRWDEWEFEFTVRYDCSFGKFIDRNVLTELLKRAGKIGIGTYRLKFGKFVPVSVTEKK